MKKSIYLLGDIHGNYNTITYWLGGVHHRDCHLIQVGDFGIGFRDPEREHILMDSLNEKLKEKNVILYAIRGNHDDPDCFRLKQYEKSNIHFLDDYSVLELEGHKILLAGGAISIDRTVRKRDNPPSWFPGEVFVLDVEKLSSYRDIDIVVTHTAPTFCNPVGWNQLVHDWADMDPGLHHELPKERMMLTEMHDILIKENKIKKWFYGHFHFSKKEKHGDVEFQLLAINEFKELETKR